MQFVQSLTPMKSANPNRVKRAKLLTIALLVVCWAAWVRWGSTAQENTPLADAVENNEVRTASALLQSGADPNRLVVLSTKPLRSAFWDDAVDRWTGLEPVARSFDKPRRESLLWLAVEQGQTDMVRLLLRQGADPNLAGNDASTALINAAERGNAALVEELLSAGARVNHLSMDRRTALTAAIGNAYDQYPVGGLTAPPPEDVSIDAPRGEGQYVKTVRLLIAAGADVNTKMGWGLSETPLHYARNYCPPKIVALLSKAGAK